jgi:hypothetical protein
MSLSRPHLHELARNMGIKDGTWVAFAEDQLIARGTTQEIVLALVVQHYTTLQVRPKQIWTFQVGMPPKHIGNVNFVASSAVRST